MKTLSFGRKAALLLAISSVPMSAAVFAQDGQSADPADTVTVTGTAPADLTGMPDGRDVEGFISARNGEKMLVTTVGGTRMAAGAANGSAAAS